MNKKSQETFHTIEDSLLIMFLSKLNDTSFKCDMVESLKMEKSEIEGAEHDSKFVKKENPSQCTTLEKRKIRTY